MDGQKFDYRIVSESTQTSKEARHRFLEERLREFGAKGWIVHTIDLGTCTALLEREIPDEENKIPHFRTTD